MFKHVEDARYIEGYKIWLSFNDGKEGEVDLYEKIHAKEGVFEPLKDVKKFSCFTIINDTLSWANGADLSPDSLYSMLVNHHKSQ